MAESGMAKEGLWLSGRPAGIGVGLPHAGPHRRFSLPRWGAAGGLNACEDHEDRRIAKLRGESCLDSLSRIRGGRDDAGTSAVGRP